MVARSAIEGGPVRHVDQALRIAVVSTPRSGNTWLRLLLQSIHGLAPFPVHSEDDLAWAELPPRCLVQLHHHRTPTFERLLADHGFRPLVLARHPLDVLISILHFAAHDSNTHRWLEGDGGNETPILTAFPHSPAFLEYATSPRAERLLSVSRQWWGADGVHCLRYEDLVRDPAAELARLGAAVGESAPAETIRQALSANTMESLRPTAPNRHFWRGRPGHWKTLLPAANARRIAAAHQANFDAFGYVCDPDPSLTDDQAYANWLKCR